MWPLDVVVFVIERKWIGGACDGRGETYVVANSLTNWIHIYKMRVPTAGGCVVDIHYLKQQKKFCCCFSFHYVNWMGVKLPNLCKNSHRWWICWRAHMFFLHLSGFVWHRRAVSLCFFLLEPAILLWFIKGVFEKTSAAYNVF